MSDVVDTCVAEWKRLGVRRPVREDMAQELRADLDEAAADGVPAETYLGGDARAFARRWAEERDLVRSRPRLLATAALAVLGAIPGAGLGLFFAYGLSSDAFREAFGSLHDPGPGFDSYYVWDPPVPLILGLYAFAGLCVAAGAVLAIRVFFAWQRDPALTETTRLATWGAVPAAALATAMSMSYAWYRGFQSDIRTMVGDALVAVVVFAAAMALLRLLAVMRSRPRPASRASTLAASE